MRPEDSRRRPRCDSKRPQEDIPEVVSKMIPNTTKDRYLTDKKYTHASTVVPKIPEGPRSSSRVLQNYGVVPDDHAQPGASIAEIPE